MRANLPAFLLLLLASLFSVSQLSANQLETNQGTDADKPPAVPGPFIDNDAITWKVNEFNVARWKTLVGGIEGGQIDADDVQFGIWELAPAATYHGHKHAAPEIYHIVSGSALWQVDDTSREVSAGTTIYTKPGQVHKMINLTDEPVQAIWFWWAPGGDNTVFAAPYEFTEPPPAPREGQPFATPTERLY